MPKAATSQTHKIALFTDLHLGIHKDSKLWLDLCEKSVDFVVSTCKERGISKVIFGGDWLHNRNFINVNTLNVAISCINKLTDHFDEIFFIIGNHDIYLKNSVDIHSLKFLDLLNLHTDKIKLISKTTSWSWGGRDFLFIPWLGEFEDPAILSKKYDIVVGHLDLDVNFFIKEFYIESRQKKVDMQSIDRYLAENEIFEYASERQYLSDEKIAAARKQQKQYITKFKDLCKDGTVVYSGHFHKHELIPHDGWEFLFVGCPLELTWADAANPKGLYILDVDRGTREFVENLCGPKHVKVHLSGYSKDADYSSTIPQNFVRLFVDREPLVDEIRSAMAHLNSYGPLEPCEAKYEYIKDVSNIIDAEAVTSAYSKMKMSKLELMHAYISAITDANIDKDVLKKLATAYYDRALT